MTALSTELPALPALRLLPAPSHQPPYDDELPTIPALRLVAPPLVSQPVLRVVPPAPEPADLDVESWLAARRTPTAELPAAMPFARALVQGLLEVLGGERSLRQLLLSGKYLTLYQMAMIEAGSLDRLAIGPVRSTLSPIRIGAVWA